MAKNKLSAKQVENAKTGLRGDGDGLYVRVSKSKSGTLKKQWVFRFTRPGKAAEMGGTKSRVTEMGLGLFPKVTLAEARSRRDDARKILDAGLNPIEAKRKSAQADDSRPTFGRAADELFASKVWVNARHEAQWRRALNVLAEPLRPMPIEAVNTEAVLAVLKPVWLETPETASRLRGRIEAVLNYGRAQGWRSGENPAAWRGHLEHLLQRKKTLVKHHAAMAYAELPAFMAGLRERQAMAALALEFCILTAARSGEVFGATWSEIDLEAGSWTIPAARMKMNKSHRVPLSDRAAEILRRVGEVRLSEYVFPGQRAGSPLSGMAFEMLLRRMNVGATPHGFRSSFRDWVSEETDYSHEVAEMSLAHAISSAVERAYRRGDLFEKRRELMRDWADFLG
jgi:integrase